MSPSESSPVSIRITKDYMSLLEALNSPSRSQAFKDGLALLAGTELTRDVALYPKSIDDPEVDAAVEEAVSAACKVLEGLFPAGPGVELHGINSNFQGTLADHIRAMLCGHVGAKLAYRRDMNALLSNDRTFGRLQESRTGAKARVGYTVMRFGRDAPDLFLASETGEMRPLEKLHYADTFTSADYAVDGVLKLLVKEELSPRQERLHLVALQLVDEPRAEGVVGDNGLVVLEIADIPGDPGMDAAMYQLRLAAIRAHGVA